MDSGWFLLLELCAVVLLQAELTGGQDDLRVLLQQLMVRVDRLEQDRGQSSHDSYKLQSSTSVFQISSTHVCLPEFVLLEQI